MLVFFDCRHVLPAPQRAPASESDFRGARTRYWRPFVRHVGANYKRVVVPTITAPGCARGGSPRTHSPVQVLDVDAWREVNRPPPGHGMSKCYLTFDAQFKWTEDATDFVPLIRGAACNQLSSTLDPIPLSP